MDNKLRFIVTEEYDNVKAVDFLKKECKISARMLTRLKQIKNGITMDGVLLRTIDYVKQGSIVEIKLPSEESEIVPMQGKLDIIFEDSSFLIINKPPSMPVHPVKQHQTDTLANIVAYYAKTRGESYVFRAINRLDKDTSGIVIIAKNRYCTNTMKGKTNKTYYAICHGKITGCGTIDEPIGLTENSKMVRYVIPDGARAVTHYKTVCSDDNYSFVELSLETGRTHQIRCHMAHIGHPLLGDDLYGGTLELISRQALHCGKVKFVHPVTNNMIELACDIPKDMNRIISSINHSIDSSICQKDNLPMK